jgi:hypothetical protein
MWGVDIQWFNSFLTAALEGDVPSTLCSAALCRRMSPPVPIELEALWPSESIWMPLKRENSSTSPGN